MDHILGLSWLPETLFRYAHRRPLMFAFPLEHLISAKFGLDWSIAVLETQKSISDQIFVPHASCFINSCLAISRLLNSRQTRVKVFVNKHRIIVHFPVPNRLFLGRLSADIREEIRLRIVLFFNFLQVVVIWLHLTRKCCLETALGRFWFEIGGKNSCFPFGIFLAQSVVHWRESHRVGVRIQRGRKTVNFGKIWDVSRHVICQLSKKNFYFFCLLKVFGDRWSERVFSRPASDSSAGDSRVMLSRGGSRTGNLFLVRSLILVFAHSFCQYWRYLICLIICGSFVIGRMSQLIVRHLILDLGLAREKVVVKHVVCIFRPISGEKGNHISSRTPIISILCFARPWRILQTYRNHSRWRPIFLDNFLHFLVFWGVFFCCKVLFFSKNFVC